MNSTPFLSTSVHDDNQRLQLSFGRLSGFCGPFGRTQVPNGPIQAHSRHHHPSLVAIVSRVLDVIPTSTVDTAAPNFTYRKFELGLSRL